MFANHFLFPVLKLERKDMNGCFISPNYFENIDGLSSHSYPNHGFIGTPKEIGQHSIRGYLWELNLLKKLGVQKELPVFITETGWPHREGIKSQNNFYTTKTTSQFLIEDNSTHPV